MCSALSIHKCMRIFSKALTARCMELSEYPGGGKLRFPENIPSKKCFATVSPSLGGRANIVQASQQSENLPEYRKIIGTYLLSTFGVQVDILQEKRYQWVFSIDQGLLKEKVKLIKGMNFERAEHSLPFFKLSPQTLLSILKSVKSDEHNNICKNRLYYISEKLQCDPSELSSHLSRRVFVYTLSFDWVQLSLNVLLEMGVPSERIVKDLWVLKYHHQTIRKRLESVKASGRDDLVPWMVRCPEQVLHRSIKISQNTKNILGDNSSIRDYLAERLNTSPEVINIMFNKIPSVETMRVTKAKKCLDFLFAEGYTEEDIINVPRILAHSLKTIQSRLNQLRAVGVNCTNLNLLCRSKKDYKKFYDAVYFHNAKGHSRKAPHTDTTVSATAV